MPRKYEYYSEQNYMRKNKENRIFGSVYCPYYRNNDDKKRRTKLCHDDTKCHDDKKESPPRERLRNHRGCHEQSYKEGRNVEKSLIPSDLPT